jgi:hypothetical protein
LPPTGGAPTLAFVRARFAVVVALAAAVLTAPSPAPAATKTAYDRHAGMRLTLDGRVLTAELVRRVGMPPTSKRLFGRRIVGLCTATIARPRADSVQAIRVWPRGRKRLRFRFRRDISERVVWCLLEEPGGGDIAVGYYIRAELPRFVAEGSSPSGRGWRMWGWRGQLTEPCVQIRFSAGDGTSHCFQSAVLERSRLSTILEVPSCRGDTYLYGVTAPEAAEVRLRLFDGTILNAQVFDPPTGSLVGRRYFMAVVPGLAKVRAVSALAATGDMLDRRLYARETYRKPCYFTFWDL